jgi:hypothetical protein
MLYLRSLVCLCVLAAGCAAQNTAGPTAELPDAESTTPPAPSPDATPRPAATPDAAKAPDPDDPLPPPADASTATTDAGPVATPPADNESYACTLLIGINATAEWYSQGFESMVDNAKWELIRVHSGFVELWANPTAGLWSTGPTSPCAMNPGKPDRVIFIALNFQYDKLEQWLPNLQAVVKNLQAKYPGVKRIELGTYVRAPGNKPCPQGPPYRSTISEAEDQAIAMVAAANPELVRASPKFEAKTCSEFSGNPPHPSSAGGAAWAKMMAEHYGTAK